MSHLEYFRHSPAPTTPTIRVLPDRVVNQIAAGEVIERPAAVVKELVENSLDAGATQIEVEFRQGGKSYIRVEDNGRGMAPDEALLALERHATSKLRQADDLLSMATLGFRGEALPSIASVSRFTLKSRREDWEYGTEVLVNGGKLIDQRECGMAPGTRIEVAQLFNSVPARRKFLKTDGTEAAHIVQLLRLHAVARPDVAFTLIENGRTVLKTPACPTQQDRIHEIWGANLAKDLVALPPVTRGGIALSGTIGKPGVARASRREIITLVNGRPVESRTLNFAFIEAYHTYIPKGKYPLGFLFLQIDPAALDVNIHPAKREVRFRDEGQVRQFVLQAVVTELRQLAAPQWSPANVVDAAAHQAHDMVTNRSMPVPRPQVVPDFVPEPAKHLVHHTNEVAPAPLAPLAREQVPHEEQDKVGAERQVASEVAPKATPLDWRLIGRLHHSMALFETAAGLVVMHLRAAHQRITYERIARAFAQGTIAHQRLLVPIPMEFEPVAAAVLAEHLAFFHDTGFELECFGRNFYRLCAHPDWIEEKMVEPFVRDLVADIREKGLNPSQINVAHEHIARQAANKAVRIDESPSDAAVVALARDLMACELPLACPQGKPTFFELSHRELQQRFGE